MAERVCRGIFERHYYSWGTKTTRGRVCVRCGNPNPYLRKDDAGEELPRRMPRVANLTPAQAKAARLQLLRGAGRH